MNRIIAPAASNSTTVTAVSGTALGWVLSLPMRLWRRHRQRDELRSLMEAGPHLIADAGMTKEEAQELAGAPVWQSAHVPQLRHF